jgi:cytochrome b561
VQLRLVWALAEPVELHLPTHLETLAAKAVNLILRRLLLAVAVAADVIIHQE